MNKYAISGLLDEARSGRRAVVMMSGQYAAHQAFLEAADASPDARKIYRANGLERIEFDGGGMIHFRSTRSNGHRGLAVDTVFLDWDTFESGEQYRRLYEDVCPIVNASASGQIVRA